MYCKFHVSIMDVLFVLEAIVMLTVSPACVDEITLFRGCTDTSTVTTESGATAFGLALVVLEVEEVIRSNFYWWSRQRFIRGSSAPTTRSSRELRTIVHTVVHSHRRGSKGSRDKICGEPLRKLTTLDTNLAIHDIVRKVFPHRTRPVGHTHQHENVGQKE